MVKALRVIAATMSLLLLGCVTPEQDVEKSRDWSKSDNNSREI
jgi:starvation-inducible outer membrane lipoprotein